MRGFITDPAGAAGLRLADDLPEPVPAADEAVVAVRAYALNSDERNLIARRPDGWRPGQDVSGLVVRAAADGTGPAVGARVVCYLDWEGWAERIAVPVRRIAVLPDNVSFEQAAALPIAGITALRALRVGGAVLGRQVLVTGATGGVGQFAVQLAVAAGATVTALVSGPARVEEARALGAHRVVTTLDGDTLGPFHLVLEGVGGPVLPQAIRRVAAGGHIAWYGNPSRRGAEITLADFFGYAQGWNAHLVGFISPVPEETLGEDLAILVALVSDGRLRPLIGLVRDWTETATAFAAFEDRSARGKFVLTVG
ncbi:zinc-binding dehydrogenase [Nocardia stercoris]|uniref:Alcohol dehydrogenase n=1 Tax=Nocardia stercoris TaxID=2483361 RepID=A0A3M2KYI9_9NOCA|nr:zinc-binding dehydrogenase [Nocardia stercoris]RMI29333.1 alcohol dehydrogenase [Nocardia stercoris]